jgi:dienelactone hydrolase
MMASAIEAVSTPFPCGSISRQGLRGFAHAQSGRQNRGVPRISHYRPSYRKEAAEDAWNKTTAWFKKYGVLS